MQISSSIIISSKSISTLRGMRRRSVIRSPAIGMQMLFMISHRLSGGMQLPCLSSIMSVRIVSACCLTLCGKERRGITRTSESKAVFYCKTKQKPKILTPFLLFSAGSATASIAGFQQRNNRSLSFCSTSDSIRVWINCSKSRPAMLSLGQ